MTNFTEHQQRRKSVKIKGASRTRGDKKVNANEGKVKKGVRLVSQQEVDDIRKRNNLKTTNEPVGEIPPVYIRN